MSVRERIEKYTEYEPNSGCHLWSGSRNYRTGRPQLHVGHRVRNPARILMGEPKGLYVLHTCDTPACINPDHLYVGTQAENMRDMKDRGRQRNQWTK